ncbi:peptidoglycan DD-metalloendopeptidase family protein [Enterococcus sp. BWM-S5]|uniref:Peptidoglycan DD-metalloendopeptidase family protein n=1 Tax=Enterococcus larvae TaxID=2794352 RepID=A0ABS4CGW9_9ENTE|nr:phage tail tip lysozyme [Enterococcus larvae]MBP1045265.1 peptidoglycan DD-metalloendopeptidase family protein [Enterococcus larvae]
MSLELEHIRLYESNETDFSHNGQIIPDFEDEPVINRIINSRFVFTGVYNRFGQFADQIKTGNIIKAYTPDGTYQPFRITQITNRTLKSISFVANHICFDANRNFIESFFVENKTVKQIMDEIQNSLAFSQRFKYQSDILTKHQFTITGNYPVDAMIGSNNQAQNLAGVVDGELDMDMFTMTMKERLGEDKGFTVDFGVNLDSIEEEIQDDLRPNCLFLTGGTPEGDYDQEKDPITVSYVEPNGFVVTDENRVIGSYTNSECQTKDELRKWAQEELFSKQQIHLPKASHTVKMIDLASTDEYAEYKELFQLQIGDTVSVKPLSGAEILKERVVEYNWYPRKKMYKDIVLGTETSKYTHTVEDIVQNTNTKIVETREILHGDLLNASAVITGNDGGHVTFQPKNRPSDIGIMDTDDIETAKRVLRMNKSGIGFSKNGWNGPYETAWTIDGVFNANFIKAGTLEGIEFRTVDDNFMIRIRDGIIQFYDVKTNKQLGNVSAMRNGSGDVIGFGLNQTPGYSLSLGSTVPGTGDSLTVLEIPKESTGANDETLLRTWRTWEHHGDLVVNGTLSCTRLIVNGNEITGGGSGSGVTPPELTTDQEKNAWQIWQFFKAKGWSEQAIAGMLGNMESESGIIPDIDEHSGGGGYGLVQWTPKSKLVDWCTERGLDYRTLDAQCQRIQWEVENNVQWFANPQRPDLPYISFSQFTKLPDVKSAADYFIAFYEHPADPWQPNRQTQAQRWYDLLKNLSSGTEGWQNPVRSAYTITQEWDQIGWGTGEIHGGIDIASAGGAKVPVYAAHAGTVITRTFDSTGGNYIVIDHGNGYWSYYGHLDSFNVSVGQTVTNATQIGVMGTTGLSTGVHLHFEVWKGSQWNRINPRDVINF